MAITPHIQLETLPAGTTNVQSIIDSNFAIIDENFASHYVIPSTTSFSVNSNNGKTQEMDISGNNVTITGITNQHPGYNILLILHSSNVRTVTVPNTWEPFGLVWDTTTSSAVTVLSENHTHTVEAGEAIALLIVPGVNVTAYGIL